MKMLKFLKKLIFKLVHFSQFMNLYNYNDIFDELFSKLSISKRLKFQNKVIIQNINLH
jgi:hypothetical protein